MGLRPRSGHVLTARPACPLKLLLLLRIVHFFPLHLALACSDRLRTALAGANPNAVVQREDEDLAVADLAVGSAASCFEDGVYCGFDEILIHRDLELDLSQQVDGDLVSTINLGIAL